MSPSSAISLLPQPRQMEVLPGTVVLHRDAQAVVTSRDVAVHHVAEHLVADLQARHGLHLAIAGQARAGDIDRAVSLLMHHTSLATSMGALVTWMCESDAALDISDATFDLLDGLGLVERVNAPPEVTP